MRSSFSYRTGFIWPPEAKVLLLLVGVGIIPFFISAATTWMNSNSSLAGWAQAVFTVVALVGGFAFPYLQHRRQEDAHLHHALRQSLADRASVWSCVEGLSHDALDSLQKELLRASNSLSTGSSYSSSRRIEESIAVLRSLLSQPLDSEITVSIIRMQRSLIAAAVKLRDIEGSGAALSENDIRDVREILDRAKASQEHILTLSNKAAETIASA